MTESAGHGGAVSAAFEGPVRLSPVVNASSAVATALRIQWVIDVVLSGLDIS